MFPAEYCRFRRMRAAAEKLPTVRVTEEEFVAARMANGDTEEDARFQARMAKGLGAAARVGDRMLEIKG